MNKIYIYVRGGVVIKVVDQDGQELNNSSYEVVDYDDLEAEENENNNNG